jgi:hypothetical protein
MAAEEPKELALDIKEMVEFYDDLSPDDKSQLDKILREDIQVNPWKPLIDLEDPLRPTPQKLAADSLADILLYGGAAYGGKTNLECGMAVTMHRRSIIYRRHKGDLIPIEDEIIKIRGTRDGYNGQMHRIIDDERGINIRLGGMQYENDKQKYKGDPRDLICFDEVRDFLESQFRFVIGWNRSPDPEQRCRVVCTTNPPDSAEGDWIIKFWAPWLDPEYPNPALPGELRWFITDFPDRGEDLEVSGPDDFRVTDKNVKLYPKSRTFIPSSIDDNPYASVSYKATLQNLPEPLRSQMLTGDFMAGRDDDPWQVIPTAWVRMAQDRWESKKPRGARMTAMGADPARGGDDKMVLAPRYGDYFGELIRKPGRDVKTGAQGAAFIIENVRDGATINLDIIGAAGAGVYEHLLEQNANVNPIDNRCVSMARDRNSVMGFFNKRSENFWRFREALDPDGDELIALPPGAMLRADLCAPKWRVTKKQGFIHGCIQVEGKYSEAIDGWGDLKKRLGRSTDEGDAVVNAWVEGVEHTKTKFVGRSKRPSIANGRYSPHRFRG